MVHVTPDEFDALAEAVKALARAATSPAAQERAQAAGRAISKLANFELG